MLVSIVEDFNIYIDFCVWVLQVDGLNVPPFDKHKKGNKILQNQGLTPDRWQEWIIKVVTTQDLRLAVIQDPQTWIEQQLKSQLKLLDWELQGKTEQIDTAALRSSLEQQVTQLIEECEKIIARSGIFSYESIPPDVWTDDSNVQKLLKQIEILRVVSDRPTSFSDF